MNKPTIASQQLGKLTVNWEEPKTGGPIDGYKIIAKAKGWLLLQSRKQDFISI